MQKAFGSYYFQIVVSCICAQGHPECDAQLLQTVFSHFNMLSCPLAEGFGQAVPSQRDLDLLQHALACSFICKLAVTPRQQSTSCIVHAMQTLQLVVLQTVSCRCKAWVALATGLQHNWTSPCLPKDDILNKSKQFLTCMCPLASLP